MNSYFQYAYNLKGSSKFEKLGLTVQNAVTSLYIREIDGFNELELAIEKETDCEVLKYISGQLDLKTYYKSILLTTAWSSYVNHVDFGNIRAIINLNKVNNIRHPNKLFRSVNSLLPDSGIYIGRLETYVERKMSIYKSVGRYLGFIVWLVDFFLNRVIPRIPYLEKIYYYFTDGKFHAISQAEVLGRLVFCGFDIIDFKTINELSYFVVMKTNGPVLNCNPSYYPVISLNRIGKNGEIIKVYKFRTMHPYSEFLQEYVIKLNGYNKKGKPAHDFRVTRWGKMLRKLWLDELPQVLNMVAGNMKLVGLRPLSLTRYNEFPDDLKKERIRYKPGCVPPYVALNMPDDKSNIEAERIYLNDLSRHPYLTDTRYFFKALYNILTSRIRSS